MSLVWHRTCLSEIFNLTNSFFHMSLAVVATKCFIFLDYRCGNYCLIKKHQSSLFIWLVLELSIRIESKGEGRISFSAMTKRAICKLQLLNSFKRKYRQE